MEFPDKSTNTYAGIYVLSIYICVCKCQSGTLTVSNSLYIYVKFLSYDKKINYSIQIQYLIKHTCSWIIKKACPLPIRPIKMFLTKCFFILISHIIFNILRKRIERC